MKARLLFWIVVVAALWLVITRLTEVQELGRTLRQGDWPWILAAAAFQFGYYAIYAVLFQLTYAAIGVPYRTLDFLPLLFSGVFVNTVTPSGGTAGVALFVGDASHKGLPAGRAAAGNVLATVIEYITFALILLLALIYLFFRHDLKAYELVGAAVLVLWIGIQAAALFLAAWKPSWLRKALGFVYHSVEQMFARLRLRFRASSGWVDRTAGEFASAARAVKTRPRTLIRIGPTALAMHAASIGTLFCLFLAFHQKISLGPLVSGFAIGMLFVNISPVPQGIGIVEGTMTLVYTSLGVPSGPALVVTLAFRGLSFWLPFVLGFGFLRRTMWLRKAAGDEKDGSPK